MLYSRITVPAFLCLFSALCAAPAGAAPASAGAARPARNVIILGWDGAERRMVRQLLEAGGMKNLKRLADRGRFVDIGITNVTDTKAGWAEILTGYDYHRTGAVNNREFIPLGRDYSVFHRIKRAFGPDRVATAMLGVCKNMKCALPGDFYYPWKADLDAFDCESDWNKETARLYKQRVTQAVLDLIGKSQGRRLFAFVHYNNINAVGHHHLYDSKEYRAEYEFCDESLGRIVAELERRGMSQDTMVYVVPDHGFDRKLYDPRINKGKLRDHFNLESREIFLATNDALVGPGPGDRLDIAPTLLERFGVDTSTLRPPMPGRSLLRDDRRESARE